MHSNIFTTILLLSLCATGLALPTSRSDNLVQVKRSPLKKPNGLTQALYIYSKGVHPPSTHEVVKAAIGKREAQSQQAPGACQRGEPSCLEEREAEDKPIKDTLEASVMKRQSQNAPPAKSCQRGVPGCVEEEREAEDEHLNENVVERRDVPQGSQSSPANRCPDNNPNCDVVERRDVPQGTDEPICPGNNPNCSV